MKMLVLGSSPNAWITALNLADQGHPVTVVECSAQPGAPYVFRDHQEWGLSDIHLCPQLAARWNLDLPRLRHSGRSLVVDDQVQLRLTANGPTGSSVSPRDQERWPAFRQLLDQAVGLLGQIQSQSQLPQDFSSQWRSLGRRTAMEVLRLPWMSLRDLLDEWFEHEGLKGLLAEVALEGVFQGPFACGTTFHLLQRWLRDEVCHPATLAGGSARMLEAFQNEARRRGIDFFHLPGTPELVWQEGRPQQLKLSEQALAFDILWSDKDVRWTYGSLVSPRHLETEFNSSIHKIRGRGIWECGHARGAWPAHWPEESRQDRIHLNCGLRDLERAYDRVKRGQTPQHPPTQMAWTGLLDESRPEDLVQVQWGYGHGGDSAAPLERLQTLHIRTASDFERDWQCPSGHLWGGETDLSQSFFLRPVPAFESDCPEVQLCGASLAPGDYSGYAGELAVERWKGSLKTAGCR